MSGQGSNSAMVRQFNERVILTALRRLGEASKADLARHVNLTQNAAGQIVKNLEQQQLVRTTGKRTGLRGQPATLLQLDPEGAYSIGIKLGRRTIDSLLVNFAGEVLRAHQHEAALPLPDVALRIVRDDIASLRRSLTPEQRLRLAGVGLAVPHNLGSWRRELDIPEATCLAWDSFDFAGRLRAVIDLPVFVENDGTAVAVAELFQGHGRTLDDFVVIYIAGAIGGGVVLDGKFRRGRTGNAGDIGLMPVPPSLLASAPAQARPSEILLTRASITGLIRHLRHCGVPVGTGREFEAAIAEHPGPVGEWLKDCAAALVNPLLTIASLLDLQAIVIDGNLPRPLIDRLVDRLRVLLAAYAPEARTPPELRIGTIGRNAAAIGAATLPLHCSFGADQDLLFGS